MFRELVRKKQQISMEDCFHVLKSETRGVLSVLGDDEFIQKTIEGSGHRTLLLQLTPEHICGKLVNES